MMVIVFLIMLGVIVLQQCFLGSSKKANTRLRQQNASLECTLSIKESTPRLVTLEAENRQLREETGQLRQQGRAITEQYEAVKHRRKK